MSTNERIDQQANADFLRPQETSADCKATDASATNNTSSTNDAAAATAASTDWTYSTRTMHTRKVFGVPPTTSYQNTKKL